VLWKPKARLEVAEGGFGVAGGVGLVGQSAGGELGWAAAHVGRGLIERLDGGT